MLSVLTSIHVGTFAADRCLVASVPMTPSSSAPESAHPLLPYSLEQEPSIDPPMPEDYRFLSRLPMPPPTTTRQHSTQAARRLYGQCLEVCSHASTQTTAAVPHMNHIHHMCMCSAGSARAIRRGIGVDNPCQQIPSLRFFSLQNSQFPESLHWVKRFLTIHPKGTTICPVGRAAYR
ncbi:hypothetical protein P154DRAFT_333875 [Amniculicola lignicola CBS 123094]|uniref:Uncharacterized protein n=1 Tax=Amniculicola lignicola CBS 123094 TaxID=1392246 RepID=A0A6A5W283_9PLEO|nr:hypothetical protein P154DRAFT_333875 [Amniculicola lignicola CBS 123094]